MYKLVSVSQSLRDQLISLGIDLTEVSTVFIQPKGAARDPYLEGVCVRLSDSLPKQAEKIVIAIGMLLEALSGNHMTALGRAIGALIAAALYSPGKAKLPADILTTVQRQLAALSSTERSDLRDATYIYLNQRGIEKTAGSYLRLLQLEKRDFSCVLL